MLALGRWSTNATRASTLLPWLSPTLVKSRIITADAMHTQRAFCTVVIRFGGHYVLIAKKNQPTLWDDLRPFFTDQQADAGEWDEDHTWDKGHGRLEKPTTCATSGDQ
ncbi:MAG TPA: hypothetical protein VFV38_51315 [Ktedonobacteraceae bacterium]|nr:hypothetical protein [Ktedonobacteraceae bacterium]